MSKLSTGSYWEVSFFETVDVPSPVCTNFGGLARCKANTFKQCNLDGWIEDNVSFPTVSELKKVKSRVTFMGADFYWTSLTCKYFTDTVVGVFRPFTEMHLCCSSCPSEEILKENPENNTNFARWDNLFILSSWGISLMPTLPECQTREELKAANQQIRAGEGSYFKSHD